MKNEQIKAEILQALSSELDELIEDTDKIEWAYDYEERYLQFTRNMNKILLQKIVGEIPKNRNKKTLYVFRRYRIVKKPQAGTNKQHLWY